MRFQAPTVNSTEAPMSDFNWAAAADDVVLRQQPATAIYLNPFGMVVVRQEADPFEDDPFIVIAPNNALAVAQAIIEAAGVPGVVSKQAAASSPTPGASRVRRLRARRRASSGMGATPLLLGRTAAE